MLPRQQLLAHCFSAQHSTMCTHSLPHSLLRNRNCFLSHRKLPYKNIVPGLQLRPTPCGRERRRRRRRRPMAFGDVGRTLVRRSRVWRQGAVQLRSAIVDAVIVIEAMAKNEKGTTVGTFQVSDECCYIPDNVAAAAAAAASPQCAQDTLHRDQRRGDVPLQGGLRAGAHEKLDDELDCRW